MAEKIKIKRWTTSLVLILLFIPYYTGLYSQSTEIGEGEEWLPAPRFEGCFPH